MYIAQRDDLEELLQAQLGKVAKRHQAELEKLLGVPPDPERVPESFWAKVEKETAAEMVAALALIFATSEQLHGFGGDGATLAADGWAACRSAEFAAGWTDYSRTILDRNAVDWQQTADPERTRLIASPREIRDVTETMFGGERIRRAAVTETTQAEADGGKAAMEGLGVMTTTIWRHSANRPPRHSRAPVKPCQICSPLENLTYEEWRLLLPVSGPPAHPYCDCFLEFVDPATLEPINPLTTSRIAVPRKSRIYVPERRW